MTEETSPPDNGKKKSGVEWQTLNRTIKIDSESAHRLIHWVGPYLLWIVAAVAWGIIVISTFFAWSLIQ